MEVGHHVEDVLTVHISLCHVSLAQAVNGTIHNVHFIYNLEQVIVFGIYQNIYVLVYFRCGSQNLFNIFDPVCQSFGKLNVFADFRHVKCKLGPSHRRTELLELGCSKNCAGTDPEQRVNTGFCKTVFGNSICNVRILIKRVIRRINIRIYQLND